MTFSKIGRILLALVATAALALGMTACGGGTIGYMYVAGSYYNQISGFKIDQYTGNLTPINHAPFASSGANPATILIKTGGRYLYVINSGTGQVGTPGTPGFKPGSGAAISLFAIGGDGVLTFQQTYTSQGQGTIWASFDPSGNFLYVLDRYSPFYNVLNPATNAVAQNGSITTFAVAGDTGRLTLVTNSAVLANSIPLPVFEVGPNPIMTKANTGNCLFTLSANQVFPYVIGSGGQLTVSTTGPYTVSGATNLTSINPTGSFIFLTDAGTNQIFSFTSGTGCQLQPISGGQQANLPGTANPVNSLLVNSGKFLYVINKSSTGAGCGTQCAAQSNISAFTVTYSGQIAPLRDPNGNPY